ncbi:MAG: IS4 family transposase [Acidobacteriota bacterium]|nr:IS4 family transposase [Acidobacteriota bacterium]
MTSPCTADVLCLFERIAPESWFENLTPTTGSGSRRGIYSFAVVIWLMIVQRMQAKGTLGSALQQLLQNRPVNLLPSCKRVRDNRISPHVGGYCQARQKMPTRIASKVSDHILAQLQAALPASSQKPVFLLDGSSLELEHTGELAAAYPPAENQYGKAHWPILRIAVVHNLANGLALRPSWGAMYGPHAVSEQALAEELMNRLPPGAVVVGDRNFGVFSIAHAATEKGLGVLLRLTEERFKKLWGGFSANCGQERSITWQASNWDHKAHPDLPAQAVVVGRILVVQMQSGSETEFLYLFTTLSVPAEEILEIYRCRWYVETDLRSLKTTIRLHHLTGKSKAMIEKELLIAITAYNMVRAVMGWAAQQTGNSPRSLSFSQVQDVVEAALPVLAAAASPQEYALAFQRMLNTAAHFRLPNRSHRRAYPRLIWGHCRSFPKRKPVPLALPPFSGDKTI